MTAEPERAPTAIRAVPVPTCPLCGTAGVVRYDGLTDCLFGVPGTWSYRACPSCAHLWLDPRPVAEDVPLLYVDYYTHAAREAADDATTRATQATQATTAGVSSGVAGGRFRWLRDAMLATRLGYTHVAPSRGQRVAARLASAIAPLRRFVDLIVLTLPAPPGRLLDVGSGDGAFLAKMRTLGWDVEGLEPDAAAVAASAVHGLRVHHGTLEANDLPDGAFDAVTLSHVIEHVADPVAALAAAKRLVRPGGRVVFVTPNARALGLRHYGRAWRALEIPRHFHVFTAANAAEVTARAGLEVERTVLSGRSCPYIVATSDSIRRTGRADGARAALTPRRRAEALLLLAAEETVARSRGEELIVVARRPS